MSKKKKSIARLGEAVAQHEKNTNNAPTSAVQQLVEAFLSTNNPASRQKKISDIKTKFGDLNALLKENMELLISEVEQALLRAATGYTITEHKTKLVNGVKTVEKIEKYIRPSQAAIEFYLVNKKPDEYSRAGGGTSDSSGAVEEILEAFRNA